MSSQLQGDEFSRYDDLELLRLLARLRAEVRRRRLADNVGATGELLAIEHFRKTAGLPKLQRAPAGTKNVDALSRNGDRYSIKTVCEGVKTGTVYPDSVDRERQLFEFILVVRLTPEWSLATIHMFSWSEFVRARSWDKRMNAWYLSCSSRALSIGTLVFDARATAA